MKIAAPSKAFADLLVSYPPESRNLALEARRLVLSAVPGAAEYVDRKSRLIGYGFGKGYKDMICAIMPTQAGVTLGIGWATELPDPEKLLEGSGKVHRHVKLKHKSDVQRPALKALLRAALARWKATRRRD